MRAFHQSTATHVIHLHYLYMLHILLSAALRQKNGMGIKIHAHLETLGTTLYSPNVDKSEKKI